MTTSPASLSTPSSRQKGGMTSNPFGGHFRLDKLHDDAFFDLEPGNGIAAAIRMTILDAVHSYLFWGLGKNGCTPDEFQAAAYYLFVVTDDTSTWPDAAWEIAGWHEALDVAKREFKTFELTEDELRSMTFPAHYEVAGFSKSMTIDRFRRLLKAKRRNIIEANRDQILSYLKKLRSHAAESGEYLNADAKSADVDMMLVQPTPEGLAALVYPRRVALKLEPQRVFMIPRRERGRRAA